MIFLCLLLSFFTHAGKIADHKIEMNEIVQATGKYEKRMDELKALKSDTGEGPTLENIVSEIADIHKKLLDLKKKKKALTDHLKLEHPREEVINEIALMRETVKDPKDKNPLKGAQKDDALDKRLDRLLKQVNSQYARTAKDREEFVKKAAQSDDAVVIEVGKQMQKKKEILQEDKDKYLKENLKTKMKINDPKQGAGPDAEDAAAKEPADH